MAEQQPISPEEKEERELEDAEAAFQDEEQTRILKAMTKRTSASKL